MAEPTQGISWKNMCPMGKQATICFFISFVIFTITLFSGRVLGSTSELWALKYWGPGLYFCLLNFVLRYLYKGFTYEVSVRSAFLGATFATGIFLTTYEDGWKMFGYYMMVMSTFHFTEFMSVALTNPNSLSVDSFILNHSREYIIAAVSSWVEFAVENYFFPEMKMWHNIAYCGVFVCSLGETLRKTAMFTAKNNFNHTVQFVKKPDHKLVTHGVYSLCRHPSYVGWFYWSIGTQIILLNPICICMYALASYRFFRERVYAEELALISFFGHQYIVYQKKVPTGLPFINGYVVDTRVRGQ